MFWWKLFLDLKRSTQKSASDKMLSHWTSITEGWRQEPCTGAPHWSFRIRVRHPWRSGAAREGSQGGVLRQIPAQGSFVSGLLGSHTLPSRVFFHSILFHFSFGNSIYSMYYTIESCPAFGFSAIPFFPLFLFEWSLCNFYYLSRLSLCSAVESLLSSLSKTLFISVTVLLISSISTWFLQRLSLSWNHPPHRGDSFLDSYLIASFFIRVFNVFVTAPLSSLCDGFNISVISGSGSDDSFISSDCLCLHLDNSTFWWKPHMWYRTMPPEEWLGITLVWSGAGLGLRCVATTGTPSLPDTSSDTSSVTLWLWCGPICQSIFLNICSQPACILPQELLPSSGGRTSTPLLSTTCGYFIHNC